MDPIQDTNTKNPWSSDQSILVSPTPSAISNNGTKDEYILTLEATPVPNVITRTPSPLKTHNRKITVESFSEDPERAQLIDKIMALQDNLMASLQRIEHIKEEYHSTSKENQVLLKYVNNLMSAAAPVASTPPPQPKRRQQEIH